MIKKLVLHLSSYNSFLVVIIITMIVITTSVPLVYILIKLFNAEYTKTIFIISITAPFLMVPPTIVIILKLSKYLKYFKDALENEIEENKKKDIILFEQARFVLMGEMIANISHQWKQPLNTIGLAVVSVKTSDKEIQNSDKIFDIIEENINYLADTIDDFMSFFDKRTYSEVKSLQTVVSEVKSISYANVLSSSINLDIKIEDNLQNVKIASSISQVLLNLINNAIDAFSKELINKEIKINFITQDRYLKIVCCDNAGGIDKNIIDKIFDPYFTTKVKSQGTGIGLYMSKQIIQKLFHAEIRVDTKLDKTCFEMRIPYSDKCVVKIS